MKLWTYHPSTFTVDDPNGKIDSKRGTYWNDESLQYRTALPQLQQLLGTDQFLWCCTTTGCFVRTTEEIDLVEWELDVPTSEILAFYRVSVWEDIVHGRSAVWANLFIDNLSEVEAANRDVGVWIRFPLISGSVTRCAPLPPLYPKRRR